MYVFVRLFCAKSKACLRLKNIDKNKTIQTCDKLDGCTDAEFMWRTIFSSILVGPVMKPNLRPELTIFEKESSLITLLSESIDRKLLRLF